MKLYNYEFVHKNISKRTETIKEDNIYYLIKSLLDEKELLNILSEKGNVYAEDEFDNSLEYNENSGVWEIEEYAEETYTVEEIINMFDLEGLEEFNNGEYTFKLDDNVYLKQNHQEWIISDDWTELFKIEK